MAFVDVTKQGHVGIITMNRPETLNALSNAVFADLIKALDVFEQDDDLYVGVLTGAGRAFVAGADIAEMSQMNVAEGKAFGDLGNATCLRMEMMQKPLIAAVNGFALGGGCELAMACDIRIASEKAKFGQPEVGLGITPGFGGTQRMPRIVGTAAAMELILSAKTINAERAKEIGLVSQVVAPDQLMDVVMELANAIAGQAQVAVRAAKQSIRRGMQCDISTASTYEAIIFATCFGTEDQKDAMKAFVGKTKLDGFKNK
ncbi:MAG: enoyl-CoA hydratase-related protein [Evtepia sp.]